MAEKKKKETLENTEKYIYNSDLDTYVIPMKHRVKPFVIKGFTLRAIRRALSNEISPAQSAGDVALRFKILEADFAELKKVFRLTRESFPLTDEEVQSYSVEFSAETIIEEKRAEIFQTVQKAEWKQTQDEANKWREFQNGKLDLVKLVLDGWTPPEIKKISAGKNKSDNATLFFCLSDWHVGGGLNPELSNFGNSWGAKEFNSFIVTLSSKIVKTLQEEFHGSVRLLFLGDILDGLRGKTEKGTPLTTQIFRDEQYTLALNGVVTVIQTVIQNTRVPIEIDAVRGNHDSVDFFMLMSAVKALFANESRITFNNHATRTAIFEERGCLFAIDHGAHDTIEAKIPQGARLESYIQSLFIQYAERKGKMPRLKYFIQGDLHHFEACEYNDFEFIMCGSPSKSLYSDVNNWHSRPSQLWLYVTENGVEKIGKMFVDKPTCIV